MYVNQKKTSSAASAQTKDAEKRRAKLPAKRKRQYKHIIESEKKDGRSVKSAKRIAMATIMKNESQKRRDKRMKQLNH